MSNYVRLEGCPSGAPLKSAGRRKKGNEGDAAAGYMI